VYSVHTVWPCRITTWFRLFPTTGPVEVLWPVSVKVKFVDPVTTDRGRVEFANPLREQGIFRYRDWYDSNPASGDLTVFDIFSSTPDFKTMALSESPDEEHPLLAGSSKPLPRGQLPKFDWFDGFCRGTDTVRSDVPCDLFLLSWTVTPRLPRSEGTAFVLSYEPNRNLVDYLSRPEYQGTNKKGFSINLLYTDAVEFSRSVDLAVARNGLAS